MPVAVCTNCAYLMAGIGTCPRCGQEAVPPESTVTPELRCANGFHYVGDNEPYCRCGDYMAAFRKEGE
jgi:hypothetical protein